VSRQPFLPSQQSSILEIMQQLINRGYNVNNIWHLGSTSSYNTTPGGVSPAGNPVNFYQSDEALKLFLKSGADPSFIYINGTYSCTPLLRVIQEIGRYDEIPSAIKILVDAGANVNQKANPSNSGALTPIELAKKQGKNVLVRFLKEKGGTE